METKEIPIDDETYDNLEKLAKVHDVTVDEMAIKLLERFMKRLGC